jgi:hypothetical protein
MKKTKVISASPLDSSLFKLFLLNIVKINGVSNVVDQVVCVCCIQRLRLQMSMIKKMLFFK